MTASENQENFTTHMMAQQYTTSTRAGMSVQTSIGTTTVGGHGEKQDFSLRVASGNNGNDNNISGVEVPGSADGNDTGQEKINTEGTALVTDAGQPGKEKRKKAKPNKEGQKALARYKAALKILDRLGGKESEGLSPQEQKDVEWARETVANSRANLDKKKWLKGTNPAFANKIEEGVHARLATKRQRSVEEQGGTQKRPKNDSNGKKPSPPKSNPPKIILPTTVASVVKSKELLVALIDQSVPYGKITGDKWRKVEMKLLEAMMERSIEQPGEKLPVFNSAGWLNDCKMLQCTDQFTLDWVKQQVSKLNSRDLWDGADLIVVPRVDMPAAPKAKVFIPRLVPPSSALALLKGQNPDIPTGDWKVLHVGKPAETGEGQFYILQINEAAEKTLYDRSGKMAWGCGVVYLRLKRKKTQPRESATVVREKEPESETDSLLGCEGLMSIQIETDIDSELSGEELDTTVTQGTSGVSSDHGTKSQASQSSS